MSREKSSISRRKFVRSSALVSGGVALLPGLLAACKDNEPGISYTGDFGFREGVASFDPSASSIILWTRYTSATNESGDASTRWEVATTSDFNTLAASGTVPAAASTDYTVAVHVTGLTANQKYYYRFRSERIAATSVVGETRTLPTGSQASSVKLAGNAAAIQGFEQANQLLIDDLQYLDASRQGYVLATFTASSATADYRHVGSLDVENSATITGKTVVEI